jgi:hypothetical protein
MSLLNFTQLHDDCVPVLGCLSGETYLVQKAPFQRREFSWSRKLIAHAMFDMLHVPVLGREEDAADQVSALLHLGKTEARRLIAGAAYVYKTEAEAAKTPVELKHFADAHGTPAQRFYNLLCIAYGADPELFGDMVKKGHLPKIKSRGLQR